MEFVLPLALVLVFLGYRAFTKPNKSDKLTLLNLHQWIDLYTKLPPFEAAPMATALIVQSITVANSMGLPLTVSEFMQEKSRNKKLSTEVVDDWLDFIHEELTKDLSIAEMYKMPARAVGAMAVFKQTDINSYQSFLRSS
ncbi:conserved protein of unknown function [Ectopseudomonas oleovorans]|uniref:Uncharacterized protein n=1 Tax=Ectopseudomonas oleovorans TaxID=301 RepID=A0A653B9Z0_ECTOL|nr:conserved protein of unknown function [Pseudomonas oleovorans]